MTGFWTDTYRAHFQKYFNKPFDVLVHHDSDGFALKVAIHDRATPQYRVYASMGLADKLLDNDEDDFGEVILMSDVADGEVPRLFVNALFFILQHDIPLGSRFAIGGIDQMRPAFASQYKKSALYFTLARDDDDSFNRVRKGEEFGRVYQAVFISPEENRFLEECGPEAFDKKLWAQLNEDLRIGRPSCLEHKPAEKKLDTRITGVETGLRPKDPPV